MNHDCDHRLRDDRQAEKVTVLKGRREGCAVMRVAFERIIVK
jgi:hypothetical protein